MTDALEIGRITRAHGLRGEVVVVLVSNVPERLDPGSRLDADGTTVVVAHARPHQDRWLVRFEGCSRREDVDALVGATLRGAPIDDPDALWIHEMLGADVVEIDGTPRGTVVEIHANPAADLLILSSGAVVPLTFVTSVRDAVIVVDGPDGLFDLDGDG